MTPPVQAASSQAAFPSSSSSTSKKKGKKKSKKGKAAANPPEELNAAAPSTSTNNKDEDIDAILKELNLTPAANPTTSTRSSQAAAAASPLLGVDTRKLRGDEELRRIFGAGVIEAVERQEAAETSSGSGGHGVRRRGAMPRNMPRRRPLRKSVLVNAREDWPWMDTGLAMVVAGRGF
jgi:hypothetical protein